MIQLIRQRDWSPQIEHGERGPLGETAFCNR
jgi:hypothetical protein